MKKMLSTAQKEYLEKRVMNLAIAKEHMGFFLDYLYKELSIDNSWKLCSDLSGFEKDDI
jgi:hypothetical protein